MLEKYPNRSIILIDTLSASLAEGLLVYKAVQKANEGADLETTAAYVESIKLNNLALFTVDELGTLLRGGRISLTKALLGTLLNMKPALKVDDHGKLVPFSKARGRKNAINEILNAMDQKITDTDTVFISHADSVEEALRFKEEIEKRHPDIKEIVVGEIGPVIGAHAGPGTLAVFFFGSAR
jgi:DegV family protein with EDD domain